MEPYSGNPFVNIELVEASQRHVGVHLHVQSMGVEFNWTLNQEVLFSSVLTASHQGRSHSTTTIGTVACLAIKRIM